MAASFRFVDPWTACPTVPARQTLPDEMQSLVERLSHTADQQEAVRLAYEALATKYRGHRLLTFLRLDRFFITDLATLWQKSGFLHCNHLNYLLRTLLVSSGHFASADIVCHWTHVWFYSPHQYVTLRLKNGQSLEVDLWGKAYGIPLGEHAQGFHSGSAHAKA